MSIINRFPNFRRAKLLLKKKRYQEQLLEKTDGQLENLEKLTQDLEFAQIETKVNAFLCYFLLSAIEIHILTDWFNFFRWLKVFKSVIQR